MKKLPLLLAAAAGYVLGSKAGRERYEQIKASAAKIAGNPKVQDAAHRAQDTVVSKAQPAASAVADKVTDTVKSKFGKDDGAESTGWPAEPEPGSTEPAGADGPLDDVPPPR